MAFRFYWGSDGETHREASLTNDPGRKPGAERHTWGKILVSGGTASALEPDRLWGGSPGPWASEQELAPYSQWDGRPWRMWVQAPFRRTLGYCCRIDWSEASKGGGGAGGRRPGNRWGFFLDGSQGCRESSQWLLMDAQMFGMFPFSEKGKNCGRSRFGWWGRKCGFGHVKTEIPYWTPTGGPDSAAAEPSFRREVRDADVHSGVTGLRTAYSRGLHAVPRSECAQRKKQGRLNPGTCSVQRSGDAEGRAEWLKHFMNQLKIYIYILFSFKFYLFVY